MHSEVTTPMPMQMTFMESQFSAPNMAEQQQVADLQSQEGRRFFLENLPYSEPSRPESVNEFAAGQLNEAIDQIVTLGYPVHNIRRIVHRANTGSQQEGLHVLADWWGEGGEFSVYDFHHEQNNAKRLATIGHEAAHANTPHHPDNAAAFGGEAERQKAVAYVAAAADQSVLTGVWLNGYHEWLGEQRASGIATIDEALMNGTIDELDYGLQLGQIEGLFREETWAILNEMALTNRGGLEIKQAQQHRQMEDLTRIARVHGEQFPYDTVDLLTKATKVGEAATGIDEHLVKLLIGIDSYDALIDHTIALKQRFYQSESSGVALSRLFRQIPQYAEVRAALLPFDRKRIIGELTLQRMLQELNDDDDEETKRKRKASAQVR